MTNPQPVNAARIYSISDLTAEVKSLLENRFAFVWVWGEISNLRKPASGHMYFALKDENAQLQAVMFRGPRRNLQFDLEDGLKIRGLGRISVYEPRGTYQLIVEYMEPQGFGALQMAFEQLKRRLGAEGLFDQRHKKPLPFLSTRIGIITSPDGAVLHDILNIAGRRFPNIVIDIVPVKVQGNAACGQIATAIELFNRRQKARVQVVIIARGGGSLEDMAAFNSEEVARAVFASGIPIVSAVGHETDYTICDFVADVRAPTPSAAAELVLAVKSDLVRKTADLNNRLNQAFMSKIRILRRQVDAACDRVIHPGKRLLDSRLKIDDLTTRLTNALANDLNRRRERWTWRRRQLMACNPRTGIRKYNRLIETIEYNLLKNIRIIFDAKRNKLMSAQVRLQALSPRAILERGYSITRTSPGAKIIRDSATVTVHQELEILLARGALLCQVNKELE